MTKVDNGFAVIFTNQRCGADTDGYAEMAQRMEELAAQQPGFIGLESVREINGLGITVSYWRDEKSIRRWREDAQHLVAQRLGKEQWYSQYTLTVAKVVRSHGWCEGEGA